MSSTIELDPVSRITTGAVGEPGQRAFYIQARKDEVLVSLLLEKQQVALLAMHIDQLLERAGAPTADDPAVPDPSSLDLEEPVVPAFRVGQIALGYDDDRDLVLVECVEFVPEGEEDEAGVEEIVEPARARLWATRAQVFAMARRGEREVASGRPVCPMCGEAIDPEGHFCPRSNGHRPVGDVGR